MLYLTCTTITSVDLAHYGVSRAKDWVSVDCGTNILCLCLQTIYTEIQFFYIFHSVLHKMQPNLA